VTRFLSWLVTTAVALSVATLLVDGIYLDGPVHGQQEIEHKLVPLLLVALILGAVTSFVKPVLTVLAIPFIIVTLGLFLLVINAALLALTSWVADRLDIGFHVTGFWPAVAGAVLVTVVTWIVDGLIGESR
jgi:putative membrane protein